MSWWQVMNVPPGPMAEAVREGGCFRHFVGKGHGTPRPRRSHGHTRRYYDASAWRSPVGS